jgi:chaperonin GroES
MNFRPLYDRVLVKRIEAETKLASGLILPDTAKEKPMEARVVAIGNGKRLDDGSHRELSVKVGDRVIFGKYTGDEVKLEGEEHIILSESDILAVVERG